MNRRTSQNQRKVRVSSNKRRKPKKKVVEQPKEQVQRLLVKLAAVAVEPNHSVNFGWSHLDRPSQRPE